MKISRKALTASAMLIGIISTGAHATTIAGWTFETTQPTTAGPLLAEIGTGTALGSHSGAAVYSTPVGNGSAHSFSSNTWAVNDYYQFSVNTTGYSDISFSWDQTGSATGPRDFTLFVSTDGANFDDVFAYTAALNGSPNTPWSGTGTRNAFYTFAPDLSSLSAQLSNQALVIFRLVDSSTSAINGLPVAGGGTDRVDNVIVAGTAVSQVPLPAAAWLFGSGLLGLARIGRRRKTI